MSTNVDIESLKSSVPDIAVIEDYTTVKDRIPQSWVSILSHAEYGERVTEVCKYWSALFAEPLSITIWEMKKNLKQVDLISSVYGLSLLYTFKVGDRVFYREGRNPNEKKIPPNVNETFSKLPSNLLSFYNTFHNGWFDPKSDALGLAPVGHMVVLAYDYWDNLEEYTKGIDAKNFIQLFTNGGGGYLYLDVASKDGKGLIWWSDKKPRFDIKFWDFLDEWIVIGMGL